MVTGPPGDSFRRQGQVHAVAGIGSGSRRPSPAVDGALKEVGHTQEAGDKARCRMLVDLGRGADLFQPSVAHHHDAVGQRQASSWSCVTITVVMPNRRCSRRSSTCMLSRRFLSSAPSGSSSSSIAGSITRALASATRCCWPPESCAGTLVLMGAELHQFQRFLHPQAGGPALDAAHFQPEDDVLGNRQMREQGIALEQHADIAAVDRKPGDRRPVDEDLPPAGLHEAGDHAQAGGLAAAAGPQQGDEFAGIDGEGKPVDRERLAVVLGKVRQPNRGRFGMQAAQLPKIWLYFSSQAGRRGLTYVQSQANSPISSILVSG